MKKLINDIKIFGIRIPEVFDTNQLKQGFGESVCFVINDLLNRELIRRDFKFMEPKVKDNEDMESGDAGGADSDDENERVVFKNINFREKDKKSAADGGGGEYVMTR